MSSSVPPEKPVEASMRRLASAVRKTAEATLELHSELTARHDGLVRQIGEGFRSLQQDETARAVEKQRADAAMRALRVSVDQMSQLMTDFVASANRRIGALEADVDEIKAAMAVDRRTNGHA